MKFQLSDYNTIFRQKYFRIITFIFFRIILLTIRHFKHAFYLKKIVRKSLILGKRKSKYKFKRIIKFSDKDIQIEDFVYCSNVEKIFYGGHFTMRYVPQSNYFDPSDLTSKTSVLLPKKNPIHIIQTFHLTDHKSELCVE